MRTQRIRTSVVGGTAGRGWHCGTWVTPRDVVDVPDVTQGQLKGGTMAEKKNRSGGTSRLSKQTEKALRESERRYRLLFDNMTTAFALYEMLYDEQGNPVDYRFLDANKTFEQLTGLSVASILECTVLDVLPGTERHWIETYAKVVQTGTPVLFEEYSGVLAKWFEVRAFRTVGNQFATVFADITERKRLETEIQDAREYVENIVETIREPLLVLDSDLKILTASHNFYDTFRGTPQATIGTFIYDLGNRQWDIPELRVLLEKILPDKTVFNGYEVEHEFPDIGRKTMVLNARQIYRKEVGSHLILLAIEDITERKRLEQEVAHLASFAVQNPNAVIEVATDGAVRFANPAALAMLARLGLGTDTRQLLPGTPEELVLLQSRCELDSQTQELRLGGATFLRVVTASLGGDTLRVYAMDITERRQAEEALGESENNYRLLVESSHNIIYTLDLSGVFTFVSPSWKQMLGHENDAVVGHRFQEFVHPDDIARCEELLALALQTREPLPSIEYRVRNVQGEWRWHNSNGTRVINADGTCTSVVAIVSDVTDRKQAEEELRESEAQLRQSQKMEAIGTLAGGIAHDFNNMLTGLLGNIALMRSSLPPADPLLENLNAAETAARQATDLTKGLLAFSRRTVVLPVPMNVTAALDATLALLKQSLPATMEIVRDYEQTAWNILVDQSQMTQILLNLAVNARDAMEGKGTLTIRARNEVVGEEYLQTHPFARAGEFVHLSVTDTGPGIPPEILGHLFEPFYTTKPVGSGTGLGLSIVYGAVKQAGGWITAVSTEGVGKTAPRIGQTCSGATFDIYLPRCLEESFQSVTPSPLPVNAGSGTVLVVEDEPVVRAVAQALLSRNGFTVLTAPDGASALDVLREHPAGIGLILLDMTMPGMTTDEIVQAIRALDPTVPILLNSGYTSNGVVKQMLAEDSVQGFLGKPYDPDQLLNTINQLMKRT